MEIVRTYKLVNGRRIETSKIYERDSEWTKEDEGIYIVGINNSINSCLDNFDMRFDFW